MGNNLHSTAVGAWGSLGMAGVTNATPESAPRAWVTASSAAGSVPSGTSTASNKGPLNPGPKPAARRS